MYYKIVTEGSFFTDLCMGIDVFNIPYGTVFTAPDHSKYKPKDPKCMLGNSCLHFAQGAFDTMLWYNILSYPFLEDCIYQIQPITKVTKRRAQDSGEIYQCGAHKIKILRKQSIDDMYECAIQEYYTNPDRYKKFKMYIAWWKEHVPMVSLKCHR